MRSSRKVHPATHSSTQLKELNMKRTLVAVSLAVLAAPVFAVEISAPYEQAQVDRILPNVQTPASSNSTRTQDNPWANDYNFIAPAL
jgi:hypothetical protein